MLLNADVPQALDALLFAVRMAFMRIYFIDAEGEHGQREELEGVLGAGAVVDFREDGVLGAGFLVGIGVEGADGALD